MNEDTTPVSVCEAEVTEDRRGRPRVGGTYSLEIARTNGEVATGNVVDVSETGLRVVCDCELERDEVLRATISIPGSRPLQATARVIYSSGDVAGLSFELAPIDARQELVRLGLEQAEPIVNAA
jgi:PilZ domain